MISTIKLKNKIDEVDGRHCSPIEVARVNDQVIRLSYINGEFHWHKHSNQDELFYIISGELIIQFKDQPDIALSKGEMTVIPKGIEHCPKSIKPTFVLLFEPFILNTKGD